MIISIIKFNFDDNKPSETPKNTPIDLKEDNTHKEENVSDLDRLKSKVNKNLDSSDKGEVVEDENVNNEESGDDKEDIEEEKEEVEERKEEKEVEISSEEEGENKEEEVKKIEEKKKKK